MKYKALNCNIIVKLLNNIKGGLQRGELTEISANKIWGLKSGDVVLFKTNKILATFDGWMRKLESCYKYALIQIQDLLMYEHKEEIEKWKKLKTKKVSLIKWKSPLIEKKENNDIQIKNKRNNF